MQQNIFKIRVPVMPVGPPAIRAQIHFHVSGAGRVIANLQDRAAEIRPALQVGKARMKNPDARAPGRLQLVAPQPLVLPDGLDQPLGRKRFIPQKTFAAAVNAPLGVKILRWRLQAPLLLEFCRRKVNTNQATGCPKIERN
jgi:hypothetical protein